MDVRAERLRFNSQDVIKLAFDYDIEAIKKLRAIPGARWSGSMRCWYIADLPQKIEVK